MTTLSASPRLFTPTVRWLLWLTYTAAWTAALLVPLPEQTGNGLNRAEVRFAFGKTLHIAAYAGFAILAGWLGVRGRGRWLLLAVLLGHGIVTEYLQWSFPQLGRTGSVRDVMLDWVGITLGVAVSVKWWSGQPKVPGSRPFSCDPRSPGV